VIASIKLASYMTRYKLDGYEKCMKKMLLLIWCSDKTIKAEVRKQFAKLYINEYYKS
jgi:hypothetical protein